MGKKFLPWNRRIANDINESYDYASSIGADELELRRLNEIIEEIKELKSVNKDVEKILDYLQPNEEEHYLTCGADQKSRHIVHAIRRVRKLLKEGVLYAV